MALVLVLDPLNRCLPLTRSAISARVLSIQGLELDPIANGLSKTAIAAHEIQHQYDLRSGGLLKS